jgi:hypothetical protein
MSFLKSFFGASGRHHEIPKIVVNMTKDESGAKIFNITWPVKYVRGDVISGLYKYLYELNEFGALSKNVRSDLRSKYNLTEDVIDLLHRTMCAQKAIEARPRLSKILRNAVDEYDKTNINNLSQKYNVPPLMLLRSILIEKGYSSTVLYHVYTQRAQPEKFLQGRDLKQYYLASDHDISDVKSQQDAGKRAEAAELEFVRKFGAIGAAFKTQEELTKEQVEKFGRAVVTPDVLLSDILYINGKRVHWIDFKSYMLMPNTFIYTSLIKQANRYNAEFGSGAFVFLHGTPNVNIHNTLLLSTNALYNGIIFK